MKNFNYLLFILSFLVIGISNSYDAKAQQIPPAEFDALKKLYEQTNGVGWKNTTDGIQVWDITNITNDVTNWYGVTVTQIVGVYHVTNLSLNSNDLDGAIPLEFWTQLPFLKTLDLATNDPAYSNIFTSVIPASINLPDLEYINLYQTAFTGVIPSAFWTTTLKSVSFGRNSFTGNLDNISAAINLTNVDLSTNALSGNFPDISPLTALVNFDVGNNTGGNSNNFSGSATISNGNVRRLLLNKAGMNDVTITLGSLPLLEELYLQENNLTNYPNGLFTNRPSLKILNLQSNQITQTLPSTITSFPNLIVLNLGTNQIPSPLPDLSTLTLLEQVYLNNNLLTESFTDLTITSLQYLSSLKILNLSNNNLIGVIPSEISQIGLNFSFNNLIYLNLNNNNLTGNIASELNNLTTLQELYLNNNQFESIPILNGLTTLTTLRIQNNALLMGNLEALLADAPNYLTNFTYAPQEPYQVFQDSYNVSLNSTITLYANTTGTLNSYQWYKDGSPIVGATNATYEILSVTNLDIGTYKAEVTNSQSYNSINLLTPLESEIITVNVVESNALNFKAGDFVTLNNYFGNGVGSNFTSSNFTIEFWIKAPTTSTNQVILSKWDEADVNTSSFIAQLLSTGELEFKAKFTNDDISQIQSNSIIADDTWHHVAIVSMSEYHIEMYIDGIKQDNTISIGEGVTIKNSLLPLLVGKESLAPASFEGTLDELRIWGDHTECQIAANINNEIVPSSASDLLAYHTFNQGVVGSNNSGETTLRDDSGNNRDGLLDASFTLNNSTSNWVLGSPSINGTTANEAPNLSVTGNGINITNNNTPTLENGTDFGIVGSGDIRYYELKNLGINDLDITTIEIIDITGQFALTSASSFNISSCNTDYIQVSFTPNNSYFGTQTATIQITSNDGNINNTTFTFNIQGKGKPIFALEESGTPIANNSGSVDIIFAPIDRCATLTKTFKITNEEGLSDLILKGNVEISGNSYFKVTRQPTPTVIDDVIEVEFDITYTPTEEGTQTATVAIYSNDTDQNPFIFQVEGTGNDPSPLSYSDYDWNVIGNAGFSSSSISNADLKIAQNQTPYLAFQDGSVGGLTSVMKYHGTSWIYVGGAGISPDVAINQSLVITKNGTLYVAYKKNSSDEVVVMKFNGSSWSNIGTFGGTGSLQLALDLENTLYLAFENELGYAKVIKYNNSDNTWQNVGDDEDGFSYNAIGSISITIDKYGTPYVAFQNQVDQQMYVMSYNGYGYWDFVSIPSISANQQSITIDNKNKIYVTYRDISDDAVKVIKYDESIWQDVGSSSLASFSSPSVGNIILGVDGNPYLTFTVDNGTASDVVVTKYSQDTGSWETLSINAGKTTFPNTPTIALNTDGEVYVGYSDADNGDKATIKKYIPKASKINVQGNNVTIANNDITPDLSDETNFGGVNISVPKTVTYTIKNTGNEVLNSISINLDNGSVFELNGVPNSVAAGDSATFEVIFSPSSAIVFQDVVTITTDNCAIPVYTFAIQGTGLAPDIFVEENISTNEIVYDGIIDFGDVEQCDFLDFSVRIKNIGNDVLSINTITSDNPLFSITNFLPSSLAPADEIVFIIKFSPTATTSSVSGYITINSNALNEEDYIFQVIGTGIDTTAPSILPLPSNQNVTANLGCTFINSSSLISDVLATDCNTVTYTYNLNGTPSTNAGTLANQSFDLGTTTVDWTAEDTNSNFTVGAFTITVIDPIEINVQGNNTDIVNGSTPITDNYTDFGDVDISTPRTVTYTIQNTGTSDLTINSIGFTTTPIGFAINNISSLTVSAGGLETFDVTFSPLSITDYSSQIKISSDDCEDGTYLFDIKGSGVQNQEIDITGNGNPISSSGTSLPTLSNHTIFQNALVCGNATSKRTYEIKNTGISSLTVNNITINNTTFTLSNLPTFPLVLIPNATHSFDVIFNPSTIGTQTAIITVTNNDADESSYTFTIQAEGINDTQAPTLIAMQNFTRNTDATTCFYTNQTTNTVQQIPNGTANDNCRVASYDYVLSGATLGNFPSLENVKFNRGITTIRWTARDENGSISNPNEFTVTVIDTQTPVIQAPAAITRMSNLYSCSLDSAGINLGIPTVSDNCLVRVFNDAPVKFPIGQTTVIWTAIDSAGNQATANQLVTITEQFFVLPSDSLILVDIYNQMGGQNWIRPWDLNKPVSTWSGINVSCGKIILINLSNNNLTGTLPNSVLNLAQINELNFSLNISGNRLSFESAEDFVGQVSNFIYSPQSKIYAPQNETVRQSQSITFNSQTEGNFTSYQWYKNQNRINGATSPTFTITNALPSDAGIYVCEMKNTVANRLILERNPITLTVQGFVNPTDSLALVNIFLETGGTSSWTTLWDLTQPVATWKGVTVSGNKVIELDLSSRNLTGTLPNVFDAELFSELRYLSFFDNHLEGEIPATIGDITTLTYLDLDKNNFEGSVPASFGNLINLQALWLSRNNLTELPNEIGNLTNLKNLYLNGNKFTSLPETIGNLSELLVLNVNDNRLSELPNSVTTLKKLVELYANRNFISVLPTGIQNLIALTVFEMNTNSLSLLDLNLVQLTNLRTLRIAENKLEFDDLLPFVNSTFTVFDYAPQAPINEEMDILRPFNSSVTFTTITQGNGNKYQWLQNGNPVSTLQNFTITRVKNTDVGLYTALITNPSLPNLTLQRRSVRLNVECQAGQNFEINQPQQTLFCESQPFVLKLEINENVDVISQIRWKKDGIILAFANEKSYTVTQKGIYTAEALTENGCTILSNKVEITTLPNPEVTIFLENEKVLTSTINSQETVTYQWLKDGNVIENAFENAYTPTQTGEYSLLVLTESGCSSLSQIIIFTADDVTGIEEPKELRNLALYPNPNNGTFFIDFGTNSPNGEATFILIDAIGRKINLKTEKISSTRYTVKTNNLAGGIYQLQIQTKDGIAFRKFVIEE